MPVSAHLSILCLVLSHSLTICSMNEWMDVLDYVVLKQGALIHFSPHYSELLKHRNSLFSSVFPMHRHQKSLNHHKRYTVLYMWFWIKVSDTYKLIPNEIECPPRKAWFCSRMWLSLGRETRGGRWERVLFLCHCRTLIKTKGEKILEKIGKNPGLTTQFPTILSGWWPTHLSN